MVALWNRADHYIFILWFLSIFYLLFSSPNLSGRTLDVYHPSTHGVALVQIKGSDTLESFLSKVAFESDFRKKSF